MRPILVFGVLGTLLDLGALDAPFARGFGEPAVRREWFDLVLRLAFTAVIAGEFRPFDVLAAAALRMLEARRGTKLDDMTRRRILEGLASLPAYPDAAPALERLQQAGFEMHALSNGTQRATEEALVAAGVSRFFTGVQSAEQSEEYKPKTQVYRNALTRIDVAPRDAVLVSAHAWDVAGARGLGMRAAFVARPGEVLDPGQEPPQIVAADLGGVADRLIFFPLTSLDAA